MRRQIGIFRDREDGGAITDWIVLTASLLGLMRVALISFNTGIVRHAALTG